MYCQTIDFTKNAAMKFCSQCAGELVLAIPPGDNRERHVCAACTTVHYHNPRIITVCLPTHGDRVLLCRRAIAPRHGYWTLPGGFLENGETIADGAVRETWEEACARVIGTELYGVIDIPAIGQVYMFQRATLADLDYRPGEESLEVALFREADIPWQDIAFPVITTMLRHYFSEQKSGQFSIKTATIHRSPLLPQGTPHGHT